MEKSILKILREGNCHVTCNILIIFVNTIFVFTIKGGWMNIKMMGKLRES